MAKTRLKKAMSIFLSVVMVLSCWVWVAPHDHTHANAAATTYKWRVTVYMTKGSKNTDSGNVTIYWKTNNGTGSEGSAQIYSGSGEGAIWQNDGQTTVFVSDSSLSGTVCSGKVPANAYPYKATATIDLGSAFSSKIQWQVKVEVLDANGNVLTDSDYGSREDHTIGWGDGKTYTATDEISKANYPYANSLTVSDVSDVIISESGTATRKVTLSAVDNYGVDWVNAPTNITVSNSNVKVDSKTTKTPTLTFSNATADYATNISATYSNVSTAANNSGSSTCSSNDIQVKVLRRIVFDNLIDFGAWNTTSVSNGTISNVTENGFTLTSNDGASEGTSSSPFFAVEAGKKYKIDIDFIGDGWDVYIFFHNETSTGLGLEFQDGPTNRYSSNGSTGIEKDNAVFTAPATATKAMIRVDANGSNNTVRFENIRVYEVGKVESGISYLSPVNVTYDSAYLSKLPTPTKAGHTFIGWVDADGNTITNDTKSDFSYAKNLYSKWEISKYTVTWKNHDGSTIKTETVEYGKAATAPTHPNNKPSDDTNHYTANGWDNDFSNVTSDLTVTAQYMATPHTWDEGVDTTPATCTKEGVKTYTCKACSHTKTEVIDATGHTPGAAATCTEPQKCTVCQEVLAAAKGHTPGADATCTEPQKCTVCQTELAAAKGHTPGAAATCTEPQKCTVCQAELAAAKGHTPGAAATCTEPQKCTICQAELAAAKGHTPGADATCTEAQKCTVCQTELAAAKGHTPGADATCTEAQKCTVCQTELAPALTHNYSEVVTIPTCTAKGYTTHTCSRCGDTYVDTYVDATGHSYKEEVTKEPTCEDKGEKTFTCSVCGDSYAEEIAANGHDYGSWIDEVSATCVETGTKGHYTCSVCKKNFDIDKNEIADLTIEINPEAHDIKTTSAKAPTCTEIGWDEYVTCQRENCGYTTYKAIPAKGHDMQETTAAVAPTCTEDGKTAVLTCANECGKTEGGEVVPATGHTFGALTEANAATCIAAGNEAYKQCVTCEKYFAANADEKSTDAEDSADAFTTVIDSTNHVNKTEYTQTDATCTEIGYTAGTFCEDCDKWIVGHEEISALTHDWNEWETVTEVTCQNAGQEKRTCKREVCTAFEVQAIAQLSHSYTGEYKWNETAEPKTHSQKCVNGCNNYGNEIACTFETEVTAPTCYEQGYTTYTCSVCNNSYKADFTTREHIYEYAAGNGTSHEITCQHDDCEYTETENCSGGTAYCNALAVCEKCDAGWGQLNADNHALTDTYIEDKKDATCEGTGYTGNTYHKCCQVLKEEGKEIPATGHNWDEGVVTTDPTCTAKGVKTFTCQNDKEHTYTEAVLALDHIDEDNNGYCDRENCGALICDHVGQTSVLKDKKDATCLEDGYTGDKHCAKCDVIVEYGKKIEAIGHKDENKDHACDNGCTVYQGTHDDEDKDHACDYGCTEEIGECTDSAEDKDHVCDYGCGAVLEECLDEDKDHACDNGCDKYFGTHEDSTTDGDHICDYGCGAVLEECSDAASDGDHNCDVCDKAEISEHEWADATCTVAKTCKECSATEGTALGHKDDNKDHACDNGCNEYQGAHKDSTTDDDHLCDYGCGETLEDCSDKTGDNDHNCDICGKKNITEHTYSDATCTVAKTCTECNATDGDPLGHKDVDKNHICENNCGEYQGKHEDFATDNDHVCDYGCGAVLEACVDTDFDHACDNGCDVYHGTHDDDDKDHACDYGCEDTIGIHADSAEDKDHVCDYGCGAVLEECSDAVGDGDHNCDVCDKAEISAHDWVDATCAVAKTCKECSITEGTALGHKDESKDHVCDNGCDVYQGTHADSAEDNDHVCDYGCGETLEECSDAAGDGNHNCDICGKADVSVHIWVDATCTVAKTCSECSATEGSALGHDYDEVVKAPTCEEKGYTTYTCSVCGDTYTGNEVAALGHKYVGVETKAPTCTEDGVMTYTCSNDASHTYEEAIAATGHTWNDGEVIKAATAENNGEILYTCLNDGTHTDIKEFTVADVLPGMSEDVLTLKADVNGFGGNLNALLGADAVFTAYDSSVLDIAANGDVTVKAEGTTALTATTSKGIAIITVNTLTLRYITFVMLDGDVTYELYVGDAVAAPGVQSFTGENGFIYTFKNWDKAVASVVDGNATYTAVYTEPADYTEFDKLEEKLNDILENNLTDEELYEENKKAVEAILDKINKINEDRNTRDKSEQNVIDEAVLGITIVIDAIYIDPNAVLEIKGANVFYTGSVLDIKVMKMPENVAATNVSWTSSNEDIVFFSNGRLVAVGIGKVTLTATSGRLSVSKEIEVIEGGRVRMLWFTSLDFMQFIIEDAYVASSYTGLYWSNSSSLRFTVFPLTGFPFDEYEVLFNGKPVEADEDGYYLVPAESGVIHISVRGIVNIEDDDGNVTGKFSFWDWLLNFFRKIINFFKNLFNID